jgi:hypothetical protein
MALRSSAVNARRLVVPRRDERARYRPSVESFTNMTFHGALGAWFLPNRPAVLGSAVAVAERRSASRWLSHVVYGSVGFVPAMSICGSQRLATRSSPSSANSSRIDDGGSSRSVEVPCNGWSEV